MANVPDTITTTTRHIGKKGGAHKLRASGWVPVAAYGPSSAPRYLALQAKQFVLQRRTFGLGHIYNVSIDGQPGFKALIKEIQVDPISRGVLHVDLYEVDMHRPIRVDVPVELTGKPAGLIDGGMLTQILHRVTVQCLPDAIPAKLVADVSPLKVGDSLHLSDLHLPEGVKLQSQGDEAVALVAEPEEAPAATPAAATPAAAPAAKAADQKK